MRRAVPALALAFVLAASGCTIPGNNGNADPVSTVTPAPVPGGESFDRLAPVGGDFEGLLDRHRAALDNESYNVTYRIRAIENASGSVETNVTVRAFVGSDKSVYYEFRRLEDTIQYAVWSNGTLEASKLYRPAGRTYRVQPSLENEQLPLRRLSRRLSLAMVTSTSREGDQLLVRGRFTELGRAQLAGEERTVERSSVLVEVGERGGITAYRADWVVRLADGRTVTWSERLSFDRSSEQLPRPAWVDPALANATARESQTQLSPGTTSPAS